MQGVSYETEAKLNSEMAYRPLHKLKNALTTSSPFTLSLLFLSGCHWLDQRESYSHCVATQEMAAIRKFHIRGQTFL